MLDSTHYAQQRNQYQYKFINIITLFVEAQRGLLNKNAGATRHFIHNLSTR